MIAPPLSKRLESAPAVVALEGHAEQVANLSIEVAAPALRMVDAPDAHVAHLPEPVGEQSQGDALSGTGLPGDHDEAAVGHGERDAASECIDLRCRPEGFDGCAGAEGVKGKAEVGQHVVRAHESSSSMDSGPARYAGGNPVAAYSLISDSSSGAIPLDAGGSLRGAPGTTGRRRPSAFLRLSCG